MPNYHLIPAFSRSSLEPTLKYKLDIVSTHFVSIYAYETAIWKLEYLATFVRFRYQYPASLNRPSQFTKVSDLVDELRCQNYL